MMREMLDGPMMSFLGLVLEGKGSYEDNFLCGKFKIVFLHILSVQGMSQEFGSEGAVCSIEKSSGFSKSAGANSTQSLEFSPKDLAPAAPVLTHFLLFTSSINA